jgi:enamine deaminase RidA (YjgF/YER057c/UK114 family)
LVVASIRAQARRSLFQDFCAVGCLGEAAQTGLAVKARRVRMSSAASTTVGVTRLAGPDFMIEIEAVAVVNL